MPLTKLKKFFTQFPERKFRKLEDLIPIDEPVDHIFFLTKGYVRQYTVSPAGDEFNLNIFKPNSFFPLNLALHQKKNPYYFSAFTQGKYRAAPVKKVVDFLQQDPKLLFDLTKRLTSGINGLLLRMESIAFGNAEQRVASTLYLLYLRFGVLNSKENKKVCPENQQKHKVIQLNFTHQELAFFSGLTRETVSGVMANLREKGVINYQSQLICVVMPEKLKDLSSLPIY